MMEKNKIIDKIVKKLILSNFDKESVFSLIELNKKFANFDDYIYYLLILGQKKYDDLKVDMCASIFSYISYLIKTRDIFPPNILDKSKNDLFSNEEIFLFGAKGYDSKNNFYFDVHDNLYICLDNVDYFEYKNIYNIKYNHGFLDNKINKKIFTKNINKIFLFKKENNLNKYLGEFKIIFNSWIYVDKFQYYSFVVADENDLDSNLLSEYDNILRRLQKESVNLLRRNIIEILNNNNVVNSILFENINNAKCHMILFDAFIQFCLLNNQYEILRTYLEENIHIDYSLSVLNLIPSISLINEYQLSLLANSFDILCGCQITSDYLNNVFVCNSNLIFEENNIISLRFIKSFKNYFFDIPLNQKMFLTSSNNNCIYIFKKIKNKYLFMGIYKCFKLTIGNDLLMNKTPIFKLKKISDDEYIKHVEYLLNLKVDNSFKNVFLDIVDNNELLSSWTSIREKADLSEYSVNLDHLNSILYKYNWITRKCISLLNNYEELDKKIKLYKEFDNKNLNIIFNIVSNNFLYLAENKILKPYTIAFEMTKHNWNDKELFNFSYMDHYQTNRHKYETIIKVISMRKYR